jgi:hypothetical protein
MLLLVRSIVLLFTVCGLPAFPFSSVGPSQGQQGSALTLAQLESLVKLHTSDQALAAEIRRRGLAFSPTKGDMETLERGGAGPQTIQALDELRPMIDEAKQVIPKIIDQIYAALDQGSAASVLPFLSPSISANPQELDRICKPFTHRAHYVEAVIERPNKRFEVRMRTLFKPEQEVAYLLIFGLSSGKFILIEISDSIQDWFRSDYQMAEEQARRFVYALNAGRNDVAAQIVSTGLKGKDLPDLTLKRGDSPSRPILKVDVCQGVSPFSYKGLKIRVSLCIYTSDCCSLVGDAQVTLLFDFGNQPLKIVAWTYGYQASTQTRWMEDPNLEAHTLARFGLTSLTLRMRKGPARGLEPHLYAMKPRAIEHSHEADSVYVRQLT